MAQWTSFLPDQPSGWTRLEFERFVGDSRWIFARTMPRNPHEYTLRSECADEVFSAAVRYIREHGHMEEFAGKPYKALHFAGHKYWTMGSPLEDTILINRKPLAETAALKL